MPYIGYKNVHRSVLRRRRAQGHPQRCVVTELGGILGALQLKKSIDERSSAAESRKFFLVFFELLLSATLLFYYRLVLA
jgi:hypothetical protein